MDVAEVAIGRRMTAEGTHPKRQLRHHLVRPFDGEAFLLEFLQQKGEQGVIPLAGCGYGSRKGGEAAEVRLDIPQVGSIDLACETDRLAL
jgi:hypothetical protein